MNLATSELKSGQHFKRREIEKLILAIAKRTKPAKVSSDAELCNEILCVRKNVDEDAGKYVVSKARIIVLAYFLHLQAIHFF